MDRDIVQKVNNIEGLSITENIIIDGAGTVKAVALKHDVEEDGTAPIVIAKGKGYIAQKIIDSANRHNISIVKDARLADGLMPIKLGHQIPTELYEAVAHIYMYLLQIDESVGDGYE